MCFCFALLIYKCLKFMFQNAVFLPNLILILFLHLVSSLTSADMLSNKTNSVFLILCAYLPVYND